MVEAGVIDDMTAGQMTQQLLLEGSQPTTSPALTSSSTTKIEDENIINISEDGKVDV